VTCHVRTAAGSTSAFGKAFHKAEMETIGMDCCSALCGAPHKAEVLPQGQSFPSVTST